VAALLDVWGLFSGARPLAKLFVVIHLLVAVAFFRERTRLSAGSAGGRA
jgi:hypothetical protein